MICTVLFLLIYLVEQGSDCLKLLFLIEFFAIFSNICNINKTYLKSFLPIHTIQSDLGKYYLQDRCIDYEFFK